MTERSETYWDIVWKQFRRNALAFYALWAVVPLVGTAILAPLLASNIPLIFTEGSGADRHVLFPWARSLFTASEPQDLFFNMALVLLVPWAVASIWQNRSWQAPGRPMRERVVRALVQYFLATVWLSGEFYVGSRLHQLFAGRRWMGLREWFDVTKLGRFELVCLAGGVLAALLISAVRRFWQAPPGSQSSDAGSAPEDQATSSTWSKRVRHCLVGSLATAVILALPQIRPLDKYRARNFPKDDLTSGSNSKGVYVLVPFGPIEQDVPSRYKPPFYRKPADKWVKSNDGFPHLMGTDDSGRDVLARMIYGTRIAITVGLIAVGLYLIIGCVLGAMAGYFGGTVDLLISRTIEVVMVFPSFFLILTLVALVGKSIYIIMGVIGITGWPTIARLIRGEVLAQRAADYVTAAQALGLSHARIIFRHILPNSLTPALVAAPFGIAGAIVTEAGLSLLGFGVEPPAPSWGTLLKLGSDNYNYWWLVVMPSLGIFYTVTVLNLIGDGAREAMDPRLRSMT